MNNPIANYIRNIIYSSDKASLHLLPCPTGIGKTYSTVIEIAELLIRKAKDGDWPDNAPKRIWFATDLIENVTDAHRNLIDIIESSDELSKEQKVDAVKYIDYIPSNADCMSKISSQELSEFFISIDLPQPKNIKKLHQELEQLLALIELLKKDKNQPYGFFTSQQKRTQELANQLYSRLLLAVRSHIQNFPEILELPKAQSALSKVLPGVRIENDITKVIFCTTSKLLHGIDFKLFKYKPLLKETNSLFIIDEFDKQSRVILDFLVDNKPIDILEEMRLVSNNLKTQEFEKTPAFEGVSECFTELRVYLEELFDEWKLHSPVGLEQSIIDNSIKDITLFSDKLAIHTGSHDTKIFAQFCSESNKTLLSNQQLNTSKNFTPFLQRANTLLMNKLSHSVRAAAEKLIENEQGIKHHYNDGDIYQASKRVLNQLNLGSLAKRITERFLFNQTRRIRSLRIGTQPNYHARGLKLTDISIPIGERYIVECRHHNYDLSPSALIAEVVCNDNKLLGISATAESESVLHNFDLEYLRNLLGDKFHGMPANKKLEIQNYYDANRKYAENGVTVVVTSCQDEDQTLLHQYIKEAYGVRADTNGVIESWSDKSDNSHLKKWTGKLTHAITNFCESADSRYMVALLNRGLQKYAGFSDFIKVYIKTMSEKLGQNIHVFERVNANYLRFSFKAEVLPKLENTIDKVILISTYQTMGAGTNLDYQIANDEELNELINVSEFPLPEKPKTDIDTLYLEAPTHMFSLSNAEEVPSEIMVKKMHFLHNILSLHETNTFGPLQAKNLIREVLKQDSSKGLDGIAWRQVKYKDTNDFLHSTWRVAEQAVGRTARTSLKREKIDILIDVEFLNYISLDCRRERVTSHEYKALLASSQKISFTRNNFVNNENKRLQNRAKKGIERTISDIRGNLKVFSTLPVNESSVERWQKQREFILKKPTLEQCEPSFDFMYVKAPTQGEYIFQHDGDPDTNLASYDFFFGLSNAQEVSEEQSGLVTLMKNDVVRDYFIKRHYSTNWGKHYYILNPIAFNNLYKGALGESAGTAILEKFEFSLKDLPTDNFEVFDSIVCSKVQLDGENRKAYIDFKHWELTKWRTLPHTQRSEVLAKLINKAEKLGLHRLVICNTLGSSQDRVQGFDKQGNICNLMDAFVLAIPALINEKSGETIISNIMDLREWMQQQ